MKYQATQVTISNMLGVPPGNTYLVPRYQREYSWKRDNWEALFDDLDENEPGYFLGSIICINGFSGPLDPQFNIVDGQQRLITLSLLISALYTWLGSHAEQLDRNQSADHVILERSLVLNGKTRIVPQTQNHNRDDYEYILGLSGALPRQTIPRYYASRRISKAYEYFLGRIEAVSSSGGNPIDEVFKLYGKLQHATFVMIEVPSATNAHILFESLNNRGLPLSAVDLIKNKLLSEIEKGHPARVEPYYKRWNETIVNLGSDAPTQERFFRHYYNATRNAFALEGTPIASRSNLIAIYESLIEGYQGALVDSLADASSIYAAFSATSDVDHQDNLQRALRNLSLIQGASSYVLMLHLLLEQSRLRLDEVLLKRVAEMLIAFFVRRNLTGLPGTNQLDRVFIGVIDSIEDRKGTEVVELIRAKLSTVSAADEQFEYALNGPIYEDNESVTRFILCHLAERRMVIGTWQDLWIRKGGTFVWSIEHVLPQSEPLRSEWNTMVGNGNAEVANDVQRRLLHRLGNLTLTGYNAQLGNLGFVEKRDRKNAKGDFIGYKNGLWLNTDLKDAEVWNEGAILARGKRLVEEARQVYQI